MIKLRLTTSSGAIAVVRGIAKLTKINLNGYFCSFGGIRLRGIKSCRR